ncbi:MAG: RING finger protein [Pirellulaceae bacterium]
MLVLAAMHIDEEGVGCFGVLAFFVVVAIVFILGYTHTRKKQAEHSYRRVAQQRGGSFVSGGYFGRPVVVFNHRDANVVLDVYASGGKHKTYYTQVHIDWPDESLRCEVYPEGFFNRLSRLLGMTDIEIGSPNFDDTYVITGNSPERITALLTPGVQIAVERLKDFLGNGDIYIAFQSGELLVKKRSYIREFNQLQQLIHLSLELYEQASAVIAEGITFVEAGDMQLADGPAEDPICQVCGEPIVDRMVVCRACRTPHHQDCWKYYGACSTYGCGQKTFRRPEKQRR